MKRITATLVAVAAAAALAAAGSALAGGHGGHGGHFHHGGHGRVFLGIGLGAPLFWPWYYPPAYYPPAVVAVPSSPPVYVEQGDDAATAKSDYWYYCPESKGYYPYVRECPRGWQRVAPEPPPS